MKQLLIMPCLIVFFAAGSYANSATQSPIVQIDTFEIIGQPTVGNPVQVQVRFTALMSSEIVVSLVFPQEFVPTDDSTGESIRVEHLSVQSGLSYERTYPFILLQDGKFYLQVSIFPQASGQQLLVGDSRKLIVDVLGSTAVVYDCRNRPDPGEQLASEQLGFSSGTTPQSNLPTTVKIAGKVCYFERDEFIDNDFDSKLEVPGATVILRFGYFGLTGQQNTFKHPVSKPDRNLGQRNIHYDITNANGEFNFEFSFNGSLDDLQVNQIWIFIARSNEAVKITDGDYMTLSEDGYQWFRLEESFRSYMPYWGNNVELVEIEVDQPDINDLRMLLFGKYSRDFMLNIYGNSLENFELPQLKIKRSETGGAQFYPPLDNSAEPYVQVRSMATDIGTIAHEYGHYVQYKMWGSRSEVFTNADYVDGCGPPGSMDGFEFREGTAHFFSFCVRNWANRHFGGPLRIDDTNLERAPFIGYEPFAFRDYSNPDIRECAAIAWNLYDGYGGDGFEAEEYDMGDNDDISGFKKRIFETIRLMPRGCISSVDPLKPGLLERFKFFLDDETDLSLDRIFDFITSDQVTPPPMGSPQAIALRAQSNGTFSSGVTLSWSSKTYPVDRSERNAPDGYKIYKIENGIRSLLANVASGNNTYDVTNPSLTSQYLVTSFNSGGESCSPRYAIPSSISANWNMVSIPTIPDNSDSKLLFPNAISEVFLFDDGYQSTQTMTQGLGYWAKFALSEDYLQTGRYLNKVSIPVQAGWNMIGSISLPLNITQVKSDQTILSGFAKLEAGGYTWSDNIQPGKGYWVKMAGDGTITLDLMSGPGGQLSQDGYGIGTSPSATDIPVIPILTSPPNTSTGHSLSLNLAWQPSEGTAFYRVQVARDIAFANIVVNDSGCIPTSRYVSGLSYSTAYYWRVRAQNSYGKSDWSSVWAFTTQAPPPPPPIPVLLSPSNTAIGQPLSVTVSWQSSTSAISYRVQVARDNAFTNIVLNDTASIPTNRTVSGLLYSTTYYWRVRAQNNYGMSNWSSVWNFRTADPPPPPAPATPTLASPVSGSTNIAVPITLQWNAASGAATYRCQVSVSSTFTSTAFDDSTITATSRTVSGLQYSRTYYWRVRAKNSGGISGWTSVWNFTTQTDPAPDPCEPSASSTIASIYSFDQISVIDGSLQSQKLFVRNNDRNEVPGLVVTDEMPPETPPGVFHARFQSNKMFESVGASQGARQIPIKLKDFRMPVTLSWDVSSENRVQYWLTVPGKGNDRIELLGRGAMSIHDHFAGGVLKLEASASSVPCDPARMVRRGMDEWKSIPLEYRLHQAYPNPFNPVTAITYELPEDAHVSLVVYNILGQVVETLVDQDQVTGINTVSFEANDHPSGLYFYRLTAGNFTDTKKMMLIK